MQGCKKLHQKNLYLKHFFFFFPNQIISFGFFYEGLVKKRIYSSCIMLLLRNTYFFSILLLLSKVSISCCEHSFYIFSIVILKWKLLLVCQHFNSSEYSLVRSSILSEFQTVSFKRIFFFLKRKALVFFKLMLMKQMCSVPYALWHSQSIIYKKTRKGDNWYNEGWPPGGILVPHTLHAVFSFTKYQIG